MRPTQLRHTTLAGLKAAGLAVMIGTGVILMSGSTSAQQAGAAKLRGITIPSSGLGPR